MPSTLNTVVPNVWILYKAVRIDTIEAIRNEVSHEGPSMVSTTRLESNLKGEFGDWVLQIDASRLPAEVSVIPVEYTCEWMASNPTYCRKVTGVDMDYWVEWAALNYPGTPVEEAITDEISSLYADEAEVILQGLTHYDLEFAHIKGKLRRQ